MDIKNMSTEELEEYISAEAITVMNACNLSGIVYSFARVMDIVCELDRRKGTGTSFKNTHPACVLFSEKIASLTRSYDFHTFSGAYDWCKQHLYKETHDGILQLEDSRH